MIPGDNILEEAFQAIDTEVCKWVKYTSRTLNAVGQWVTIYADPVDVDASVQAVSRNTYMLLGLDLQKDYTNIFVPADTTDLDRDVTGDRMILSDGKIYQIESTSDWYGMDGWTECLCVRVPSL